MNNTVSLATQDPVEARTRRSKKRKHPWSETWVGVLTDDLIVDPLMVSLTPSLNRYFLSNCCVPSAALDTRDPAINKQRRPCSHGVYVLMRVIRLNK